MNAPSKMSRIVDGLRYSVEDAELIADNAYWDGNNFERQGRNTFLYKTKNGRYFTVELTQWMNERDSLTPVEDWEALQLYEGALTEHYVPHEEAFPQFTVEDA